MAEFTVAPPLAPPIPRHTFVTVSGLDGGTAHRSVNLATMSKETVLGVLAPSGQGELEFSDAAGLALGDSGEWTTAPCILDMGESLVAYIHRKLPGDSESSDVLAKADEWKQDEAALGSFTHCIRRQRLDWHVVQRPVVRLVQPQPAQMAAAVPIAAEVAVASGGQGRDIAEPGPGVGGPSGVGRGATGNPSTSVLTTTTTATRASCGGKALTKERRDTSLSALEMILAAPEEQQQLTPELKLQIGVAESASRSVGSRFVNKFSLEDYDYLERTYKKFPALLGMGPASLTGNASRAHSLFRMPGRKENKMESELQILRKDLIARGNDIKQNRCGKKKGVNNPSKDPQDKSDFESKRRIATFVPSRIMTGYAAMGGGGGTSGPEATATGGHLNRCSADLRGRAGAYYDKTFSEEDDYGPVGKEAFVSEVVGGLDLAAPGTHIMEGNGDAAAPAGGAADGDDDDDGGWLKDLMLKPATQQRRAPPLRKDRAPGAKGAAPGKRKRGVAAKPPAGGSRGAKAAKLAAAAAAAAAENAAGATGEGPVVEQRILRPRRNLKQGASQQVEREASEESETSGGSDAEVPEEDASTSSSSG